jgi:biopolymer transport protein ExbD
MPDLTLAIGENTVKRTDLVSSLDGIADMSKDKYVFLRADKAVPYGELMGVMEILRSGGYSRIKLVALEAPPAAAGPAQGAVQP